MEKKQIFVYYLLFIIYYKLILIFVVILQYLLDFQKNNAKIIIADISDQTAQMMLCEAFKLRVILKTILFCTVDTLSILFIVFRQH